MAEAFGVGAGIVGVLGLTIQIIQVVSRFGMDWKNAPSDVKDFMRELQTLKTVLSETRTNLEDPNFKEVFRDRRSILQSEVGPNAPAMDETKLSIELCQAELEKVLDELKVRDKGHRLGWERLKGPFLGKTTRDSVDKLRHCGQLLNSMVSMDTMHLSVITLTETREARREQQEWHNDEKNQAIMTWISSLSFEKRQQDILSRRHSGTGHWLLDHEVFEVWRNGVQGESSVLWCPGIAGAGKSVMTSVVVEHLQNFFTENDVSISYIYCDYKDRKSQTAINLISSLVNQTISQEEDMPKEVINLYAEHRNGQSSLSLNEYSKLLTSISTHFRRFFIVVDALDEHMVDNDEETETQMTLLDILLSLQHQSKGSHSFTLFFTSRENGLIQERLARCARIEIKAADSDIESYLRSRIRNSTSKSLMKVRDNATFVEQIVSTLVTKAQGMFLLPRLHLDQLECQTNVRDLRVALKSLPTKLEETYNDAMDRIQNQVPEHSKLALSALSWISNALRPLQWTELQHALAVRRGDRDLDEEALEDEPLLLSISAGLITYDAESRTMRLAHFTVEEYYKKRKQKLFPDADSQIAETCMTYLSFDAFKAGPCQRSHELATRLRQYSFLAYAAQNWGYHTRRTDEQIDEDIAMYFLENSRMTSCCIQVVSKVKYSKFSRKFREKLDTQDQTTGLHLAAEFGLLSTFKRLLGYGIEVNSIDSHGRTPLICAAIKGQVQIVKYLVDRDDVTADSQDQDGQTALSLAAEYGRTEIVELLLERDDVVAESRAYNSRTPLLWAAIFGHEAVVRLLLVRDDVVADSRDNQGQTPLSWAATLGDEVVVQLLLERDDVAADSRDDHGQTPLSWAAERGQEVVVRLLLDRDDIVADSRDHNGRTPLSMAARRGQEAVVRLLLDRDDVVADSRDHNGRTPLSMAAEEGREAVVRLLLDRDDVVADSRDYNDQTPLSWAAINGHEAVVRLLLDRDDVVADSRDNHGQTPLSWAAKKGHEAVVRLLLGRDDVVADSRDHNDRTPLSFAAQPPWASWRGEEEHEAIVKLLLDRPDVAVDSQDKNGHTPLYYATKSGDKTVVRLLEDKLKTLSTAATTE